MNKTDMNHILKVSVVKEGGKNKTRNCKYNEYYQGEVLDVTGR